MPHAWRVCRIKIQGMGLSHLVMLMVRVRVMEGLGAWNG